MKNNTEVKVNELPMCDIEGCYNLAYADAKIKGGAWGNICYRHFEDYHCELGLGKGQKFIYES